MKLLSWGKDGGPESSVTGLWFVEIKWLFSIVLLRFEKGSTREAFHSHAFNALTWWLKGEVVEQHKDGSNNFWSPSLLPKFTSRSTFHRVIPMRRTWALSFRGPWSRTWLEFNKARRELTTLTHGREVLGRSVV